MSKLKVLDLFSGIGGFSLGLERTGGFETVAFCEIDKDCQKVLKKHWPTKPIFEDVRQLEWGSFAKVIYYEGYGTGVGKPDVICGGFPCQDISVANTKGKGLDGNRSGLWSEYKRVINEIKPEWVVIENVPNLRSKGLTIVLQDLWEIGYDAEWHIIPACSIGAVHRRERIWIIAHPKCELIRKQSRGWRRENRESAPLTRVDGKERLATNPNYNGLWSAITTEEERRQWRSKTAARFSDVFGQISEIKPSICRKDDGLSRRLDKNRLKQLGNAVVPQIVELIGNQILEVEKI